MIRFCIEYGDNVTDGAQMMSALNDAMRNIEDGASAPFKIKNDNDSKQLVVELGIKCEDPHQDAIVKVSIRSDYETDTTEDPNQLKLPFEESANEKIEKVLDGKTDEMSEPSDIAEPGDAEVAVETATDEVTNGCVDEDGTPEIEIASDTEIAEEAKPEAQFNFTKLTTLE